MADTINDLLQIIKRNFLDKNWNPVRLDILIQTLNALRNTSHLKTDNLKRMDEFITLLTGFKQQDRMNSFNPDSINAYLGEIVTLFEGKKEYNSAEQKIGQYVDRILQNENHPIVQYLTTIENEYTAKRKHISTDEQLKQLAIDTILKIDTNSLEQIVQNPTIMFAYWKKSISDKEETPENSKVQRDFCCTIILIAYATAELKGKEREKFLQDLISADIDPRFGGVNIHNYQKITVKVIGDENLKARLDEESFEGSLAFVNNPQAYVRAWERAKKFENAHLELLHMLRDLEANDKNHEMPKGKYREAIRIGRFYGPTKNVFMTLFRDNIGGEVDRIPGKEEPYIPIRSESSDTYFISKAFYGREDSRYTIAFKNGEIELKRKT